MRAVTRQKKEFLENHIYTYTHWQDFDFSILENFSCRKHKDRYANDIIIGCDTETSKTAKNQTYIVKTKGKEIEKIHPVRNIVVAWTISIGSSEKNIATIYGSKPSEMISCIEKIHNRLPGNETIFWFHNLPYDHTFLRQFAYERFGEPESQLNVKSHYMLYLEFENGIIFRDSLLLAQRKLEKWADDLNVEHKKAVGSWDYEKFRDQKGFFTKNELIYIENDTLALVECLRAMCHNLGCHIYSLVYTNTGIVRDRIVNAALKAGFKKEFDIIALTYEQYIFAIDVFQGGYTHANRFFINRTVRGKIICYDFASSYPYALLTEKYPLGKWKEATSYTVNDILDMSEDYGFMFKAVFFKIKLKDFEGMPYISLSKTFNTVNSILDNGRILQADMLGIKLTEIDLKIIMQLYDFDHVIVSDIQYSKKKYLPKWFTNEIFEFFINKTKLKHVDVIQYMINKGMLNSLYGLCAQRKLKETILENYETGEFYIDENFNPKEEYEKILKKKRTLLPYVIGIWCTAYARQNLYKLGNMYEVWIYSDTDSVYGLRPDVEKINAYNEECKQKIIARGYGSVQHEGREYWLGVAEHEGLKDTYSEFKTMGSKRYCGRCLEDNELHLTVSGVPKKAVAQLNDDISNFKIGMIFKGEQSGKLTHFYINEKKGIDENGNEYADSVDLCPCDYALSSPYELELEDLLEEEIGIPVYSEEDF